MRGGPQGRDTTIGSGAVDFVGVVPDGGFVHGAKGLFEFAEQFGEFGEEHLQEIFGKVRVTTGLFDGFLFVKDFCHGKDIKLVIIVRQNDELLFHLNCVSLTYKFHPLVTPPECITLACMKFPTIEQFVGNTPLVRLQRLTDGLSSTVLVKLEGNNPAGSVKDRPAMSMIQHAEARGQIKPGDTLIEATSGNTGIALAMAAAIKGYKMVLVMPETMTVERRAAMAAYGAELVLVSAEASMEGARDLADQMAAEGKGIVLDQFANQDNPLAHYETTGPEIWRDTNGTVTHFVSAMGTTGTIMGTSRYLKEQNPAIRIVGVEPAEGAKIPGIRRWPKEYLPAIFDAARLDETLDVSQQEAEETTRQLAAREGIFCGISSGGAVAAALKVAAREKDAIIVTIICDRGDRYLSTNVFPAG